MKKLVKKEFDEISLDSVNSNYFFGVEVVSTKGFVTKSGNSYHVASTIDLSEGNLYPATIKDCLKETLEVCLKNNWEVFVFKTHKELFKWLSE